MPIKSHIEASLVVTVVSGEVTADEVLREQARLRGAPGFSPRLDQLIDALGVTGSRVDGAQMRRIVAETVFDPGTRRAVVVHPGFAFGQGRMYEQLHEARGGTVRLFHTVEEARAWLETVRECGRPSPPGPLSR
jgi:hypothetical protein